MKRALAFILLLILSLTLVPPTMAADPDYWGVDTRLVQIGPQDVWNETEMGVGNGGMVFGDWYMQVLYFFGGAVARRFG